MEYAFFTGMGRSGTKFLTRLLSTDQNAAVRHEFIGNREFWLLSWYLGGEVYSMQYLVREKQRIDAAFKSRIFIDVNGYLQNCVPETRSVFSPREVFHFVRDPRLVVRSLYTRRNEKDIHLVPKIKEEIEGWLDGDKFTRICWNWASTTRQLLRQNTKLIRFESVLEDYGYLHENILLPLGLNISEAEWDRTRQLKVNETRPLFYRWLYSKIKGKPLMADQLPAFEKWPAVYREKFLEICGPVMTECGYPAG